MYWGTGNPNPVLAGEGRKGDNLWTCSIVAVNPDTGKLVWHFQPSPHDVHDWDAVQTPIVFNGNVSRYSRVSWSRRQAGTATSSCSIARQVRIC